MVGLVSSERKKYMRFGVFVPQGWRMDLEGIGDPIEQYETMTHVAQVADGLEIFDSIWVYDHFHPIPKPVQATVFECWTITAALARDTKRVNIGQMVTCNGYRSPALLAKMASTVDILSHGRLYFGLGAGWYEHEWRAYGYGFPETRDRMRAFREACQIITKMWTEEEPTFQGEYYSIDQPINQPKGVRKPHPSFWIGGSGEQVTLKMVARYGDACNINNDPAEIRRKLAVLQEHCSTVGRPYDEIIRSSVLGEAYILHPGEDPRTMAEPTCKARGVSYDDYAPRAQLDTPERFAQRIQELADAGINYIILNFPRAAFDIEQLHRFATEVAPLVQSI
jgi:F420-dependent oxidoreductase-like protein